MMTRFKKRVVCAALVSGVLVLTAAAAGGCGGGRTKNTDPVDGAADGNSPHPDGAVPDGDGAQLSPDGASTDGAGDDGGGDEDAGVYTYRCEAIGAGYADGFFSLEVFDGKLYAGQFGYGHEDQSMIYRYPPWELVEPGLTGISESVCALAVFDGQLYANTESSGDIFRTTDGAHWERVYDGDSGSIGCGLAVLNNTLYAVNYGNAAGAHGRILRQDGASWTVVYDSGAAPLYLREIVSYSGTLYAFGVQDEQGHMLTSSDGTNWAQTPVANRYFRGHVWNGFLWLGSASNYSSSQTGVWRYDGAQFTEMHLIADKTHVSDLKTLYGHLFAATANGWKNDSGPSALWMSIDGQNEWQPICNFTETAIWNMAVYNGELYLGTWAYGVGGSVYRVIREVVSDPVDCTAISQTNAAWEVCESGPSFCAGVFNDGAGCGAFCAPVGLPCTARFGGEPGCQKEPQNPIPCAAQNGHQSDWCECGTR
jgi:hypothetical protein